jgi:cell wall-associated NlpC family hydrolase
VRRLVPFLVVVVALAPTAPVSADLNMPLPAPPAVDATSAALFVETPMALTDVDPFSGAILSDAGNGSGADHLVVNQLADVGALAFDAQRAAEQARAEAAARRRAEEQRLASAARATATGAQTEVGSDGCPVSVPPRTLRNGAESIGAHALCVRSVASAPTPQAAKAIKYTFVNLGVPYSQPNRMTPGYFDCSSYVSKAYASAGVPTISGGWAPSTRQLAPYPGYTSVRWLTTVSYQDGLPGDLMVTPPLRADGGGHVMMMLASGFMIHTASTGDVSHVTTAYPSSRVQVVRRVVP